MQGNYFDAHLIGAKTARDLCGGIVYGGVRPADLQKRFLFAGELRSVIGAGDERFPRDAEVVDLNLTDDRLLEHLKQPPAHWWPLCGAARTDGRPVILHIGAPEYETLAKGISKLARAFPAARFLIDPFLCGKDSNWKAGVCLADAPNVWSTTRGLFGGANLWEKRADREAFHFVVGEVGAGKLLFASGGLESEMNPVEWLESIAFLDATQRGLILRENAIEALALQSK